MWIVDARQLSFSGTGLASVTAEVLRVIGDVGNFREFAVVADASVDPAAYSLDEGKFVWIRIPFREKGPDYVDRVRWSRAVLRELRSRGMEAKIFVPYAYNYGDLSKNIVWIPDLINRIVPLADYAALPFWAIRRKFYLRRAAVWWEEKRVTRALQFICYSDFVREQACEVFHLDRKKVHVIPLGASQSLLNWKKSDPVLPITDLPEKFVLYVGGFGTRKNIPMLLKACGEVVKRDPGFRCVFVGLTAGMVEKEAVWADLFRDEEVKKAAIFCPKVSEENLAALYQRCLFSLYPSRSEGFGLPIVEAAAFGKLCLCADNSSLKEIQSNPKYRIETDNKEAWSRKIFEFWKEPSSLEQAVPDVAEMAEKFDWSRSGSAVMELLRSMDKQK